MRTVLAVALAGLVLSAGCLGPDPSTSDADGAEPTATPDQTPSRDASEANASGNTGPSPLDTPPAWLPGESWTVRVTSTLLDEPVTWTRVVADFTPDGYLVGQPADDASTPGLLLHVPGLGRVSSGNLSYSVHGSTFTPVQFPLEDGREWQTSFEGDPVNATVQVQPDGTAEIHFCCSRNITAVYDPDVRAITSMTVDDGFLAYEVVDHTFQHEGTVRVPADRDIVFLEGRFAGALDVRGGPAPPAEEVTVPEGVDRVAFTQIVGSVDATPAPETGAYLERATHPNGTAYVNEQAASTDGLSLTFHDVANASGTWRFEHVAAGPGLAFTEGIGYTLLERTLG